MLTKILNLIVKSVIIEGFKRILKKVNKKKKAKDEKDNSQRNNTKRG